MYILQTSANVLLGNYEVLFAFGMTKMALISAAGVISTEECTNGIIKCSGCYFN